MIEQNNPPHILLAITGAFDLEGGIANSNKLAIHALYRWGFQLAILALNESPNALEHYQIIPNVEYKGFSGRKVAFVTHVWRVLLTTKPFLAFCDHVNLATALVPAAKIGLTKLVVRLHGVEVFSPLPNWEGKIGLWGATQLLASSYTAKQVQARFPNLAINQCDFSLLPNTHVVHDVPTASSALEAIDGALQPLGGQVILHVGRMAATEQYKGQDTLIRAMPHILEKHPQAQLVFVGRGDDRERLMSLARAQDANTQRAIFFTGFVEQATLEALYSSCYVFAMPSRGEGFGLVYIEAMRYGKPCIGSAIDAASTIIQHEKTGFLVRDPSDPLECASYLSKLLSSPDLARQMGNAGRQRVADYYLFEHFQARFLSALGLV